MDCSGGRNISCMPRARCGNRNERVDYDTWITPAFLPHKGPRKLKKASMPSLEPPRGLTSHVSFPLADVISTEATFMHPQFKSSSERDSEQKRPRKICRASLIASQLTSQHQNGTETVSVALPRGFRGCCVKHDPMACMTPAHT